MFFLTDMSEGNLEVKLPTIWGDGKTEVGRLREESSKDVKKSETKKNEKQEDAGARNGRKVTIHVAFFQ